MENRIDKESIEKELEKVWLIPDNESLSTKVKDFFISTIPSYWRSLKQNIKFFEQRRTRGWDDSDTWNLDTTFAMFIIPRLKRLKELTNGYPSDLTWKKWHNILDKMIVGFEVMTKESFFHYTENDRKKADLAMKLFSKHYRSLWW